MASATKHKNGNVTLHLDSEEAEMLTSLVGALTAHDRPLAGLFTKLYPHCEPSHYVLDENDNRVVLHLKERS